MIGDAARGNAGEMTGRLHPRSDLSRDLVRILLREELRIVEIGGKRRQAKDFCLLRVSQLGKQISPVPAAAVHRNHVDRAGHSSFFDRRLNSAVAGRDFYRAISSRLHQYADQRLAGPLCRVQAIVKIQLHASVGNDVTACVHQVTVGAGLLHLGFACPAALFGYVDELRIQAAGFGRDCLLRHVNKVWIQLDEQVIGHHRVVGVPGQGGMSIDAELAAARRPVFAIVYTTCR